MPTSHAQTIFAKSLDEITEADLTNYFQQERDETLNLEFKSYTDKPGDTRSQLTKDTENTKSAHLLADLGAAKNIGDMLLSAHPLFRIGQNSIQVATLSAASTYKPQPIIAWFSAQCISSFTNSLAKTAGLRKPHLGT